MFKNILANFIFVLSINLIFLPKPIYANLEFTTDHNIVYDIGPRGDAQVIQQISLKNNFSNIYPKNYHLQISGNKIQNIHAEDNQGNIIEEIRQESEDNLIILKFNEKSVGKNEKLTFNVKYQIPQLAEKQGQVWRLNIPSLNSLKEINTLQIKIKVPSHFGGLAYSSIKPYKKETQEKQVLTFLKNQLNEKGISLVFGEFQLFDFKLNYYLENPSSKNSQEKIPLPHNTNYQTIIFNKISPRPQKIIIDKDSNWLALYALSPKESKNITISGQAKIFAEPKETETDKTELSAYLKEDEYWQVNDPDFQKLVTKFNNISDIYDFVVNHLDYQYEQLNNNKRKGAKAAYESQSGVCTEFSDLFVTLARAKGIPARELEGFAFTDNKEIISLSANNDVLHSWAEYWNENENQWVPVDPTWTKTTDGLDFIKSFDLGHFVFVTHGQSSTYPRPPGFYKTSSSQKNIEVDFATDILPAPQTKIKPQLKIDSSKTEIVVKNESFIATNQFQLKLLGWSGNKNQTKIINSLAPLGEESIKIDSPGFWKKLFTNPKYKIEIKEQKYELDWYKKGTSYFKLQIKRLFANLLQK